MNFALNRGYRLSFLLLFLCLGGGLIFYLRWQNTHAEVAEMRTRLSQPGQSTLALNPLPDYAFALSDLGSYNETLERPLFVEERRPIVEPEEDEQPVVQPVINKTPFKADLVGVYSSGGALTALFYDPLEKESKERYKHVKKDQLINDWTVVELSPDRAVLQRGDERHEESLRQYTPHPPRPAAVAKTTPPAQTAQATPNTAPRLSSGTQLYQKP